MIRLLTACVLLLFSSSTYANIIDLDSNMDYVYSTIAYEASGTSFLEQCLVAQVIKNRSQKRNMSYYEVVSQPYQFSCNNKGARQKMKPRTHEELKKARLAFHDSKTVNIPSKDRITLYHDKSVKPWWASKVKKVIETEHFIFYYE